MRAIAPIYIAVPPFFAFLGALLRKSTKSQELGAFFWGDRPPMKLPDSISHQPAAPIPNRLDRGLSIRLQGWLAIALNPLLRQRSQNVGQAVLPLHIRPDVANKGRVQGDLASNEDCD